MSRVDIAPLRPGEHDAAVALWEAAGLTRPWNDPHADLDRALAGPSSTVLVARDTTLIGTAMVGHDGHRGWVYYLAVDEAVRRHGVGRALMAAAEEWLRGQGIPKVQLVVRDTNAAATAFYERLGYEPAPVAVLARWLT